MTGPSPLPHRERHYVSTSRPHRGRNTASVTHLHRGAQQGVNREFGGVDGLTVLRAAGRVQHVGHGVQRGSSGDLQRLGGRLSGGFCNSVHGGHPLV